MAKNLIGYFDLLGYKQFIENNAEELTSVRVGHILRDIENSLSLRKTKILNPTVLIADLEYSRVNCLNISDTIIIWTEDLSEESGINFIKVCFQLNFMLNKFTFPCRGVIVADEFKIISGNEKNTDGFIYSPNIMYGKGLLNAHLKSDSYNFASTVIDNSFISQFKDSEKVLECINKNALLYLVPYKEKIEGQEKEYVLKFTDSNLNEKYFENLKDDIFKNFTKDNKGIDESVQKKIDNTIEFLKFHDWEKN